jgi:hypothetical protein
MATEVGVHVGQRQPRAPSVSCSIFSFVFILATWAHRRSLRSPQGAEDPAQVRRALCRALWNNLGEMAEAHNFAAPRRDRRHLAEGREVVPRFPVSPRVVSQWRPHRADHARWTPLHTP